MVFARCPAESRRPAHLYDDGVSMPPPSSRTPKPTTPGRNQPPARIAALALVALVALAIFLPGWRDTKKTQTKLSYNQVISEAEAGHVLAAKLNNDTGKITGTVTVDGKEQKFSVTGPRPIPDPVEESLRKNVKQLEFANETTSLLVSFLPTLLFFGLVIGFLVWMQRRAQGQMSGIMNVGRSKAKVYTTERPKTTFDDVAGYEGVKQEIREVVDFLKNPGRFKEIGARIPKGVLLVGPPGTGKTLIARAVAGEAGVPFMSVTGSDFMEMFVGVGASRVRDLFQTARKQAPAIIFVDEIDSIGRKRGAGLGGGHDEREQTLNQMLSEMDGFETTEGIVMMAATNRPDVLDPALLRPGRFDRQIIVPLPDLDERLPILRVHMKDKRVGADVDLDVVARGTPGMSGADLANLVNEAALHAVRRGAKEIGMQDFEAARDRVLMGQRRDSMVLSDEEKERVAYHEGGHAVLAYVLPDTDPLHKVTIIPSGMALGVTQQLPLEEKHIYDIDYIQDSLCVRMGGRVAELIIFGDLSTGASNDLVGNTELARKMVREWGMSDRVGPMAWGAQGMVFLGEDLMQSGRDYSDETSRVIDEEVEQILRTQEGRATDYLTKHRTGLDAVAAALLEHETIDGAEVKRLVDVANGTEVKSADGKVQTNGKSASSGSTANGRGRAAAAPKKGPAPSRSRPTGR